jgi:hypothetical protein
MYSFAPISNQRSHSLKASTEKDSEQKKSHSSNVSAPIGRNVLRIALGERSERHRRQLELAFVMTKKEKKKKTEVLFRNKKTCFSYKIQCIKTTTSAVD